MTSLETRGRALGVGLAIIAASASTAAAQRTEADALFREGRRLLKDGDTQAACAAFEASERLGPDGATLLNVGDCRERLGQLATAWSAFREAENLAQAAGDRTREAEARRRVSALEPRLSYATIAVPDTSRLDGLAIRRGDLEIDPALWNVAVPIDPGTWQVTATAPDRESWTATIAITQEGQRVVVDVPALERVAVRARRDVTRRQRARRGEPRGRFTALRWIALGAGVGGLAAIGYGASRGIAAQDLAGRSDAVCPDAACDDPIGLDLNAHARREARRANLAFAAGGVALVGAITLWVVGGPSPVAPVIGRDHVGVAFAGTF